MAFLNISEPEESKIKNKLEDDVAIGIDLGTTNSLIASFKDGKPYILGEEENLPSIVTYLEGGEVNVGKDINVNSIKSVKRLMGKGISDIDEVNINIADTDNSKVIYIDNGYSNVTAVEVASEILKSLKAKGEKILAKEIAKAVITVPAYFDDAARVATKQAANLAGLEVLRLINEPTAAALAYGLDNKSEGIYAVYDLGGGTFDVSILKMVKGVFQVLAVGGDNNLGGDDFDKKIYDFFIKEFKIKNLSQEDSKKLLDISCKAKESLSNFTEFRHKATFANENIELSIHQDVFNNLIQDEITKTIKIFDHVISDAGIDISEIVEIILVGGSTRIKYLRDSLKNFIGKPPLDSINPDNIVALGAAIQAEALTSGSNNLLIDVIPLSLGIESSGGIVEKIIPRNSVVPITISEEFTTQKDNQTAFKIHVLQGERELASQNRSLANFELNDIPIMEAGKARIKITFAVDSDGLLNVTAYESSKNIKQQVSVKPSYGLNDKMVMKMLDDSYKNAKDDMMDRMLSKHKYDIAEVSDAINKILNDDIFSEEEKKSIKEKVEILLENSKSSDLREIQGILNQLKDCLNQLAYRKVEKLTVDLKGKNIAEIDNLLEDN